MLALRLHDTNLDPIASAPAGMASMMKRENERSRDVIRRSSIKAQ